MIPSVLSSRAGAARKQTPYHAPICGQMPPRQPCRPDRDAFGPATRTSCLPCRHVAAFKTSPPTTLAQTPTAFQLADRCAEDHFRGAPRRSAELSPRFRSGNPLCWIPGPSPKSTLRRRDPTPPPPPPQRIAAALPETGDDGSNPQCQMTTPFLSLRGSPEGMLPHDTPRCFNCISVAYVDRDALRTPALTMKAPAAARCRALTDMLPKGEHHREP